MYGYVVFKVDSQPMRTATIFESHRKGKTMFYFAFDDASADRIEDAIEQSAATARVLAECLGNSGCMIDARLLSLTAIGIAERLDGALRLIEESRMSITEIENQPFRANNEQV
jgi:hypothetical protein